MERIRDFIIKYKEFITFTILVLVSLSLISIGNATKIGGFRTLVISLVGSVQNLVSWVPNPYAISKENKALRELNIQLSNEVTKMKNALNENKNLRGLLKLQEKKDYNYIAADIVGKTTVEMRNFITLNKGKNKGIQEGMSVRTDAGLVGTIIASSGGYSMVEIIRNRDVKVACKVLRNQVDCILTWEGGDDFLLKSVPKSYNIQLNDTIVTSNYSNKYIANVPVGEVVKLSDEQGDVFQKIVIKPFVDFSAVQQVFVADSIPSVERNNLVRNLDDLLKARKSVGDKRK